MRKLLERIEKKIQLRLLHENIQHMVLFHGSPKKFDVFKTPTSLSKMDVTKGGVVYLTNDYNAAAKYAGKGGFVYTVKAKNMEFLDLMILI